MPVPHIYYSSSLDHGKTWSPTFQISKYPGKNPQWQRKILINQADAILVFWLDERNFGNSSVCPIPNHCADVVTRYSLDNGKRWEDPEMTQNEGLEDAEFVSAAVFPDGTPAFQWSMKNPTNSNLDRVFYKQRMNPLPLLQKNFQIKKKKK